jgi:hypothetical protein
MSWLIPLLEMSMAETADVPLWAARAKKMLETEKFADYKVYFAPFRQDFELLGMALFPVLLELDERGNLVRINMGDACPR